MSFLSFLSSHRLHSSHRPWIEPLNVRFDIIAHEHPSAKETQVLLAAVSSAEVDRGFSPAIASPLVDLTPGP